MQEKIEKEEIWKKKEGRKVISSVEDELLTCEKIACVEGILLLFVGL